MTINKVILTAASVLANLTLTELCAALALAKYSDVEGVDSENLIADFNDSVHEGVELANKHLAEERKFMLLVKRRALEAYQAKPDSGITGDALRMHVTFALTTKDQVKGELVTIGERVNTVLKSLTVDPDSKKRGAVFVTGKRAGTKLIEDLRSDSALTQELAEVEEKLADM